MDSKLILTLLEGVPTYATLTIATVVGIFFLWLNSRKVNVEAITSIGKIQSSQIADLQTLVKTLTDELQEARKEIHDISKQNQELRKHVMLLEQMLIKNNLSLPGDPPQQVN